MAVAAVTLAPSAAAAAPDAPPTSTPASSPATLAAPRASAGGGFGIQLLDAPVSGRDDPRASRYIVDHVTPGATIARRIKVVNKSAEPLSIDVYAGAASIDGERFQVAAEGAGSELTEWISLAQDTVTLPAGGEQAVMTTIRVPKDATRGERYGVISASNTSAPGSGNVTQVHRVGVRIYLDVGPGGAPITAFTIGGVTAGRSAQGLPSVAIGVSNTGERAVDIGGSAMLSGGPAGLGAGPFPVSEASTLAPGQAGVVTIAFPAEIPDGPWTVDVELSSGKVQNAVSATITFPAPGQVATGNVSSATPWWQIAGAGVAGLLILLGIVALVLRKASARRAAF